MSMKEARVAAFKCFEKLDKLEQDDVLPKEMIDSLRSLTAAMLTELVIHYMLGNLTDGPDSSLPNQAPLA